MSPEPVSDMIVSTGEDIAAGGLLLLALAHPLAATVIAALMVAFTIWALWKTSRWFRRLMNRAAPHLIDRYAILFDKRPRFAANSVRSGT